MSSTVSLSTPIIQTTPIAQKIDTLLNRSDLDAENRQYLLWLKCRDGALITAFELDAIATMQELYTLKERSEA